MVFRIFQRSMEGMHRDSKGTQSRSAYESPGIIGKIFIEARLRSDVEAICRGMLGVKWWEARFVTRWDAMKYLNRQKIASFIPREKKWIRLKVRPYGNDLAFIRKILQNGKLEVVTLPRIHYRLNKRFRPERPSDLRPKTRRPQAQVFDDIKAAEISGHSSLRRVGSDPETSRLIYSPPSYPQHRKIDLAGEPIPFEFQFDSSGFLILTVDGAEYYHSEVFPTFAEVKPFHKCISIPTPTKLLEFRLAENREFNPGDQVIIIQGTHAGRLGTIEENADTFASIRFTSDLDIPESVQIPLSSLRRHYRIGDYVKVKAGENAGVNGHIVNISLNEEQVTLYSPENTVRY